MLQWVPSGLIGANESLTRLRQGDPQRRPRFTSSLFQLLQPRFGFRCVRLHLLEVRIDMGARRAAATFAAAS
jgi:hypothetical protein